MNKVRYFFLDWFGDENDPPIQWVAFLLAAVALAAGLFLASPSQAQTRDFQAMRSTPDIAIAATATTEVLFFGSPARRLSIKNDCADDIYFDLRSIRDGNNNLYPVLLKQAETFTFTGVVHSLGVSHGSSSTASCTYTLILAR